MKESYMQSESRYDPGLVNDLYRTDRLAALRDLELRFVELPALGKPLLLTAKRRRQELARLAFPRKLAQLRTWVQGDQYCPSEAWNCLVTDLRQLLDEAEGHAVRDRQESTIIEKENR